jgi:hypothetical protein
MDDVWARFISDLIGRLTGPLTFRLFLQPAMAVFLAARDGVKDARAGRPPHFWRMVTGPSEARIGRAKETLSAVGRVFVLAVAIDGVYQIRVFRWFYPLEAIVTAVILAIVPYVALRGVVNRIARTRIRPGGETA